MRHQFVILFLAVLLLGITTHAQENKVIRVFISQKIETIDGKKYHLHTVEPGQTLYSISVAYGVPVADIARENAIVNNLIGVGEELRIPFISHTVASTPSVSQQSNPVRDSAGFIIHTVSRGETLFGLSRQYQIEINDITRHNPGTGDGLKVGQALLIPRQQSVETDVQTEVIPPDIDTTKFILHTVQRRETLFAISNTYVVTINDILLHNPEAAEGIRPRQVLIIPKHTSIEGESIFVEVDVTHDTLALITEPVHDTNCPPSTRKKTLNVALLLPLHLYQINEINTNFSSHNYQRERNQNIRSFEYIQFYQGFLLALDSLRQMGISVNLHIHDLGDDAAQATSIINRPEMTGLDIIFGPFHPAPFAIIAEFAKRNSTKLVNPVISAPSNYPSQGNLFNMSPTPKHQIESFVNYLKVAHAQNNIMLVHNSTTQERRILELVKSSWSPTSEGNYGFKEIIFNQTGFSGISNNLRSDKENIVFCISNNEAFISDFIRRLSDIVNDDKPITLFGLPNWQNFTNLDFVYLQNLRYHYFTTSYINYADTTTTSFIAKFREKYAIEPNNHAFKAYDMALFFLYALHEYGDNFTHCINNIPFKPLDSKYNFRYSNSNASYNNVYINILKYDYFTVRKASSP